LEFVFPNDTPNPRPAGGTDSGSANVRVFRLESTTVPIVALEPDDDDVWRALGCGARSCSCWCNVAGGAIGIIVVGIMAAEFDDDDDEDEEDVDADDNDEFEGISTLVVGSGR
jgi:hypothetical protein